MGPRTEAAADVCSSPRRSARLQRNAADAALRTLDGAPLPNTDLCASRHEWLVSPPSWLARRLCRSLLVDERDAPLLYLLLNVAAVVPTAAAALLLGPRSHALGALYLVASYLLFVQRLLLALHYSQHRKIFKPAFGALNALPVALAAFYGIPLGFYRLHHCVMHHGHGNAASGDLSSTERFQRNSVRHFVLYWLRFALGAWLELPLLAVRARRHGAALRCVAGLAAHVALYAAARRVNPAAALWLLPAPYALSSLLLMFGNWSQHVFVNPAAPRSPLGMSYTCLNHADNQRTFNDGYHASHHANARTHWSELPRAFMDGAGAHGAADALAFHGVHFFEVGFAATLLGTAGLRWLARHAVALPGAPQRTQAELVAELRRRLAPIRI